MPEFILLSYSCISILKDKDGFAGGIGNTAGSAIFNGMIIPAVVIIYCRFKTNKTVLLLFRAKSPFRDGISYWFVSRLIFNWWQHPLTWVHGVILMVCMQPTQTALLPTNQVENVDAEAEEDDEDEEEKERVLIKVSL
jgi:cation:H+ antiporter